MSTHRTTIWAAAALALAAASALAQPAFTLLSTPDNTIRSSAWVVSRNGAFAGGSILVDGDPLSMAAVWGADNDRRTLLPVRTTAISNDGSILGIHPSNNRLLLYTPDGFEFLADGGGVQREGEIAAMTADGAIIAGYYRNLQNDEEPFLWTRATGVVGLGMPPRATRAFTTAMTPDGQSLSGYITGSNSLAFTWTEGEGYTILDDRQGMSLTRAFDLSDDAGVIVGEASDLPAFWGPDDTLSLIPLLPDMREGLALACSGDGSVIGGEMQRVTDRVAFLWTEQDGSRALRDILQDDYALDLTGFYLDRVSDISQDGRVLVGWGHYDGTAAEVAWRAVIPAPGAWSLLPLSLALARRRR